MSSLVRYPVPAHNPSATTGPVTTLYAGLAPLATTPTDVPLGTSAATSTATLGLTAKAAVPLGTSAAVSTTSIVLVSGAGVIPLGTSAATSTATLVVSIPPFDPSTITGLETWLKADAIVGLADGDPVATWEDSHTSNHDATQATSGSRPTYQTNEQAGLPVVRFDGTDDFLTVQGLSANDADRTLFVVAKQATVAAFRVVTDLGGAWIYPNADGDWRYWKNESEVDNPVGGGTTTKWSLIAIRWNSTSSADGYVDQLPAVNFDPHNEYSTSVEPFAVGGKRTGTDTFNGDIAELVLYDSALSDTDVDRVRNYLLNKWVVPPELPLTSSGSSSGSLALTAPSLGAAPFQGTLDEIALYNVALDAAMVGQHYSAGAAVTAATVPLQTSAAAASATLALSAQTRVALGTSAAQSAATLALKAQTQVPLQASVAVSTGSLALTAKATVPLGTSAAVSTGTLALTAGTPVIPFQTSAATSTATLALTALTRVTLATSAATSTGTLAVRAPTLLNLASSSATSTGTLTLRALTRIPLATSAATSNATLQVTYPGQLSGVDYDGTLVLTLGPVTHSLALGQVTHSATVAANQKQMLVNDLPDRSLTIDA